MVFSAITLSLSVKYISCKVEMVFKRTWEQMACRWRFALSVKGGEFVVIAVYLDV